jgi:2-C-methyl-D-erythritol 4-phosphate cytidylyltransferase
VAEAPSRPGPFLAGDVGVVVPAAGLGMRLDTRGPEALVPLGGRPMLAWVLEGLEASACVGEVVVVTHPDALDAVGRVVLGRTPGTKAFSKVAAVLPGGGTRRECVAAGLAGLRGRFGYVAVQDAARPLAGSLLDHLAERLATDPDGVGGVVPGIPVSDTIRQVDDAGRSKGLVDRDRLRGMQSPQLFARPVLERAHALAERDQLQSGDEATLVERAGAAIRVVPCPVDNRRITTHLDLVVAEVVLARHGHGLHGG